MYRRLTSFVNSLSSITTALLLAACGSNESSLSQVVSAESLALQGSWELVSVGDQAVESSQAFDMNFATQEQIEIAINTECPEAVFLFEEQNAQLFRVTAERPYFQCIVNLAPGPRAQIEGILSVGASFSLKNSDQELHIQDQGSPVFIFQRID